MSYEDTNGSYNAFNGFGGSQPQGGGGNFASPSQGTMNQYGAAGGSGAGAKKRDPQSLTRLTIKMCNEAEEVNGKYHIPGRQVPLQQVHLVANVLTVTPKETNIELTVEDGSGTITVRMYTEGNEGESLQAIKDGEYRVIIGTLKKIGGSLCVVAFTLAPVEDHNMITMHLLDVILTHQRATVGPPPVKGANGAAAGGYVKPEGMHIDHMGGGGHNGMQQQQQQQGGGGGSVRDQVLYQFRYGAGAETDTGCSVQQVIAQLHNLTHQQVMDAIAQLSNESELYCTTDDEHYKTTST